MQDESSIHYSIKGSGDYLVLLHAYLSHSELWGHFADKLSRSFKIISIDLPGHGKSRCSTQALDIPFMAKCVMTVLKTEQIAKYSILGHSLGGYIALQIAEWNPSEISQFILLHSHPFADHTHKKLLRDKEIRLIEKNKIQLLYNSVPSSLFSPLHSSCFIKEKLSLKSAYMKMDAHHAISILKSMRDRPDRLSILTGNAISTLLIMGKYDSQLSSEEMSKLYLAPGIEIEVLTRSAHMGFIEEPDTVFEMIKKHRDTSLH